MSTYTKNNNGQAWLITSKEDSQLQGLSADAQILYVRGFRRFMNYKTGMTGETGATITYQGLKRLIEYIPDRGSTAKTKRVKDISNHYIRARIDELVRAGLLTKKEEKSQFEHLLFLLPLARVGLNAPEYEPQGEPPREPQGEPQGEPQAKSYKKQSLNAHEPQVEPSDEILRNNKRNRHITGGISGGISGSIPNGIDIISKKPAIKLLEEFGISGDLATDFVTHRKNKKAAITKTVMDGFRREAATAGIAITEAIRESIERGWTGFKADWHKQLNYKQGTGNGRYSITTEDIESAF